MMKRYLSIFVLATVAITSGVDTRLFAAQKQEQANQATAQTQDLAQAIDSIRGIIQQCATRGVSDILSTASHEGGNFARNCLLVPFNNQVLEVIINQLTGAAAVQSSNEKKRLFIIAIYTCKTIQTLLNEFAASHADQQCGSIYPCASSSSSSSPTIAQSVLGMIPLVDSSMLSACTGAIAAAVYRTPEEKALAAKIKAAREDNPAYTSRLAARLAAIKKYETNRSGNFEKIKKDHPNKLVSNWTASVSLSEKDTASVNRDLLAHNLQTAINSIATVFTDKTMAIIILIDNVIAHGNGVAAEIANGLSHALVNIVQQIVEEIDATIAPILAEVLTVIVSESLPTGAGMLCGTIVGALVKAGCENSFGLLADSLNEPTVKEVLDLFVAKHLSLIMAALDAEKKKASKVHGRDDENDDHDNKNDKGKQPDQKKAKTV